MIPFYRPYYDHSELLAALRREGGREEFESAVATRVGARYGVAFAYGHAGLIAALRAMELTQAEVVVPAYTCFVVALAIVASGNIPVFVDIDLADYNMSIDALKKVLSPRTRAIIATHMYGYPTDVNAIRNLTDGHDILLIEDRAQALHTSFDQTQKLLGDIGLCSFGANKQLTTVQGGVIVTDSSGHYEKLKAYRDQEMNLSSFRTWGKRWARLIGNYFVFRQPIYGVLERIGVMGWKAHSDARTFSAPLLPPADFAVAFMDFQARVGLTQLDKLDDVLTRRRALAQLYDRELSDVPGVCPAPIIPAATYAYYTLRTPQRDEISFPLRMLAQGVAVDQAYDYALPYLSPFRKYARSEYPHSKQAAREVINLPIYPGLSTAQAMHVAQSVKRALHEEAKP